MEGTKFRYDDIILRNIMLVINSSPLIHLARLSKARFLRDYAKRVLVPEAVHREVVTTGLIEGYSEASTIEGFEKDGWLAVEPLKPKFKNMARALGDTLGEGEAQAIALASQSMLRLLIDDDHGRRVAGYYNVDTVSTLGILLEFLRADTLTKQEYTANVKHFASQAWIASSVVDEFLRRADELGY